jgi:AcrR family transcriptional regulator
MSPKVIDKSEKRRLIAQAAARVFGEKGFENTRMEDVARAAFVGKGTLYEYFRDKDELLQGSFAVFVGDIERDLLSQIDLSAPPEQALNELARFTLQSMREWGEDYRFFLEYMLRISRTRGKLPLLRSMLSEFRKAVAAILKSGVEKKVFRPELDVEATAAALAAWFDGAILHWIVLPEGPSIELMSKRFQEMMFHGLLAPGTKKGKR